MIFGHVPLDQAEGCLLAHAWTGRHGNGSAFVLKKGTLLTKNHVEAMQLAGVKELVVARPEAGDVLEGIAAQRLAEAVAGAHVRTELPFTGRVNLFAARAGVLLADPALVDRINDVDESVTLATLPHLRPVRSGEMVATVKIIPFAVPQIVLDGAMLAAHVQISIAPYIPHRIGVISTLLPGLKSSVIEKTLRNLDQRLAVTGCVRVAEVRVDHQSGAIAAAIAAMAPQCDLIILFGASAITDRRDEVPAGLVAAGGSITHFGMPVDPGNLLLLGALPQGTRSLIFLGAPGCARSPKENGFDFVLHRVLAGVAVTPSDIRRMGSGGLLGEIITRPQPRLGEVQGADIDEE